MPKTILLTGGAGYIGSHICSELLKKKAKINTQYHILIADNLSNCTLDNYHKLHLNYETDRINILTIDLRNEHDMDRLFQNHQIDCVIHLAGLKSVKKSFEDPLSYYDNNLASTLVLLKMMKKYKVHKLIFSSSATVYGDVNCAQDGPITEDFPVKPINPYGHTKAMIEQILIDMAQNEKQWKFIILRYFNPVGADDNGLIGENSPMELPENLVPYILKVGSGQLKELTIFGNDYNTLDGTCIRDYLHVSDLAEAHLKAIDYLDNRDRDVNGGAGLVKIFNLGTGNGYSVLEMINMFNQLDISIPYNFGKRRPGDSQEIYADASLAKKEMGWMAKQGLREMCQSSWDFWTKRNSN